MKNVVHVEYPVNMIAHMLAVWRQVEDGGMLQGLLGREIAILEVRYRALPADATVQHFL